MTTQLVIKSKTNPLPPPDQTQFQSKRRCPVLTEVYASALWILSDEDLEEKTQMSSEVFLVRLTGKDVTVPGVSSSPSTSQLQTPHLAFKTQSSTSSELEMCENTEAAVPVLGSFTLYSTHPKPPKRHQRAWMVTCCRYPSQK